MKTITIFVFCTVLLGGPTADNSALAARGEVIGPLKRGMKKAVNFAFPMRVRGWRKLTITNDRTRQTLTQTADVQTLTWSPPGSRSYHETTMPKHGQATERFVYENDGRADAPQAGRPLSVNYKHRSPLGAYGEMLFKSRLVRGAFVTGLTLGAYYFGLTVTALSHL